MMKEIEAWLTPLPDALKLEVKRHALSTRYVITRPDGDYRIIDIDYLPNPRFKIKQLGEFLAKHYRSTKHSETLMEYQRLS